MKTEEESHHLSGGTAPGAPFDPADYASNEAEPSPEDPDSGEEDSSASGPRRIQWSKNHWRDVLAWSFAGILLGRVVFAFCLAEFWIGYLPQFGLLAILTAELFFSKDRCISLVSCILLVDSILADGYNLFTSSDVCYRFDLSWPYDDRFQIALVTLGLAIILWRERSVPMLVAAVPLLGIFLVLFVIAIASIY